MSAPLRFLALALVAWVGVRAATLGVVPGADGFSLQRGKNAARAAVPPPIATTDFSPIVAPAELVPAAATGPAVFPAAMPQPIPFYFVPVAAPGRPYVMPAAYPAPPAPRPMLELPDPRPLFYSPIPQLDEWPLSNFASSALPVRRSTTTVPQQSVQPALAQARIDRLQLTAWALLRGQQGLVAAPNSLAAGGTLGASQAGARLTYAITPQIAASLRTSSRVGYRGGEAALGVKLTPFRTVPVSLTAERRQEIGNTGSGRSAFALFVEGGVYQQPAFYGFSLDAYGQGGVVGIRSRDLFVDGGATFTRPLFGQFSAGFGVWGGAQPGLYRLDAGPRLSMKVRHNMRIHLDWRQRLAGNAEPGSGPAVTLAGDF